VVFSDVRAADQSCQARTDPSVGLAAAALTNWLVGHPALDAGSPAPVALGGLKGFALDHVLASGWTATCDVGWPFPVVPTVFRPPNDTADMLWWGQSEGWMTRYYLLDMPGGGVLLIAIEVDGDQAAFDALVGVVEPVIQSFVFAT
jgi:hypothetical protein